MSDASAQRPPARWRRLRVRIAIQVTLLAAALSLALGVGTYYAVRSVLVSEREASTAEQVEANARLLAGELRTTELSETELLATLRPRVRSRPLLNRDGTWFSASLQIAPDDLPPALVERALRGDSVRQRFSANGDTNLGYGIPIDGSTTYFEIFSLADTNSTLSTLRAILLAGGLTTTLAGAGLGTTIARRAVRPLDRVSETAELIARGHLDSRLSVRVDRDLVRLSTSFNTMADALEARIERESKLASDASHELRSPLTTLLVSAAVLDQRRDELSDEGLEALDNLNADLDRFQRMVNDLTEISKHDAGSETGDRQPVRVVRFVESCLKRLRRPEVRLVAGAGARDAVIEVTEHHVQRALQNLIQNAELHGGGVESITVDADDDIVTIAVTDRGPGVPVEDRERIFERFARGHSGGAKTPGSGLGLALVAGIVRSQDGDVFCDDAPGGGARFVIQLPRAAA